MSGAPEPSVRDAARVASPWYSLARRRSVERTPLLFVLSAAVALALLVPLAFLVRQALLVGWQALAPVLLRRLTATLLWNTVQLDFFVTLFGALIGVGAAYLVERTDLPLRRAIGIALVLPLAVPDFVIGYGWVSVAPSVHGLFGATLVMTLGTYPLVYLPAAAGLRRSDPALEEIGASSGLSALAIFWRVTIPGIRRSVLGGSLLIALALLAEYGAFEIVGYQTFTTEIFTEFQVGFDLPAACALSLVLVALGIAVILAETAAQGSHLGARIARQAARPPTRRVLGRWRIPAVAAVLIVVGLALGEPTATLCYWLVSSATTTLPSTSLIGAAGASLAFAVAAGVVATAFSLPVALFVERRRSPASFVIERSAYLIQGMPGLAVALGFAFFTVRDLPAIYQSPELLVLTYALMFFPLALVSVRASVAQAPRALDDVARSLGSTRLQVLRRVTIPLTAPGLKAGFALVFISTMTELTATLVLVPTGIHTLATGFWADVTDLAYAQAAPFAAVMVLVSAGPGVVLARFFDRTSERRTDAVLARA